MTHYQVLELPENASAADIRLAYRRLVLLTHPDRTPDPAAHARYLAINAAYEVLSDAGKRAVYDHQFQPSAFAEQPLSGRAKDPYYRSHAAAQHSHAPHREAVSYQHLYLRYAGVGRTVCKVLLVFSLLLGIDRVWVLDFPHELVLDSTFHHYKSVSYCATQTPNAHFRGCCDVGSVIGLRRTALLGQVLSFGIKPQNGEANPDDSPVEGQLYSGIGILFILALVGTAVVGAWPGPAGRRQVDCAITAGILTVITLCLLTTY